MFLCGIDVDAVKFDWYTKFFFSVFIPVWRPEIVTVCILETEGAISAWVETVRVCSSLRMYFNVVQGNYLSNLENIYILS